MGGGEQEGTLGWESWAWQGGGDPGVRERGLGRRDGAAPGWELEGTRAGRNGKARCGGGGGGHPGRNRQVTGRTEEARGSSDPGDSAFQVRKECESLPSNRTSFP